MVSVLRGIKTIRRFALFVRFYLVLSTNVDSLREFSAGSRLRWG